VTFTDWPPRMERFWIGNDGSKTGLHHDMTEGILCVLKGRKKLTFFPRSHFMDLYPSLEHNNLEGFRGSEVNIVLDIFKLQLLLELISFAVL
jgi:hypothetical protein